ncbi:MAG: hypothetical protein KDA52_12305 [Planctomycetaceae bacterium]|nr:hypothetical protein [Planctomycetaceae bacterium]
MPKLYNCNRILLYKRTHEGDPDPATGRFGVYNCMGRVRDQDFDAVIGIGGKGPEAIRNGLAGVVNWIGVGASKSRERCRFGDRVTMVRFEMFRYLVSEAVDVREVPTRLSKLMYDGKVRHIIIDERFPDELREANNLIRRSLSNKISPTVSMRRNRRCKPPQRGMECG